MEIKFELSEVLGALESLVDKIVYRTKTEITHEILASVGIENLEKLILQAKANRSVDGHYNYANLTKVWIEQVESVKDRTIEELVATKKENSELKGEIEQYKAIKEVVGKE